jgi:hypothetical protein
MTEMKMVFSLLKKLRYPMPDPLKLFDKISKAKISQRDRFILYFMIMFTLLVNSFTGLLLAKQLPDLVEWILKLVGLQ